jgi:hypothetical protein
MSNTFFSKFSVVLPVVLAAIFAPACDDDDDDGGDDGSDGGADDDDDDGDDGDDDSPADDDDGADDPADDDGSDGGPVSECSSSADCPLVVCECPDGPVNFQGCSSVNDIGICATAETCMSEDFDACS